MAEDCWAYLLAQAATRLYWLGRDQHWPTTRPQVNHPQAWTESDGLAPSPAEALELALQWP